MIRAKDLAALLGVSPATLSLVLNDKPGICEETRRQLQKKISEMGYGYMLTAGSPRPENAKGNLAFLIYPVCSDCGDASSFYNAVMEGAVETAQAKGYSMLIFHVDPEKGCTPTTCMEGKQIQGFVVQKPCLTTIDLAELRRMEVPFLMLDTYYMDEEVNSVSVNNEQGIWKLLSHLHALGHERIGYIGCGVERATFCERKDYYKLILCRMGLPRRDEWCVDITHSENLAKILADPEGPTAFLADNDVVAWKGISRIREAGYRVPEDVSVAGFEDREMASMTEPPLTTVHVPDRLLGRDAAEMLITKIERRAAGIPENESKLELGVELVVRGSTAAPRRAF
jgi:LacI family transcriptional regulator